MTDVPVPQPINCPGDLFVIYEDETEGFSGTNGNIPIPMTFTIFPPDKQSSINLYKLIKLGGGNLLPYDRKDEDPFTITLLNIAFFKQNPEENADLPNDIFASKFVWDLLKHKNNRTAVDLNEYLYSDSNYEDYNSNDVLFRRTSWAELTALADPPALINWKDDLAECEKDTLSKRPHKNNEGISLVSKTGAPPLIEGSSSSTRVTTRSASTLSPIKENMRLYSTSPVTTSSPVQLSPHRSPPTNMDISNISSDENDQERTMNSPVSSNKNNVEDQQRTRKVTMDSQPVPGGPERDDDGNILRKRRKARTARPRPGPDTWITPSEDVGGVIPDSPSRRSPTRVNARAVTPVSMSGDNTGAGEVNSDSRSRRSSRAKAGGERTSGTPHSSPARNQAGTITDLPSHSSTPRKKPGPLATHGSPSCSRNGAVTAEPTSHRTPSPTSSRREVTRSTSHCSSSTDVYDISEESEDDGQRRQHLSTSRPTSGSRGPMKRQEYLTSHGQAILDLILKKRWLPFVAGNLKWQHIEREKLLEKELGFRTWQSLRGHWTKTIVPDLDQPTGPKRYRISKENLKAYNESKKRRTGGGRRRK